MSRFREHALYAVKGVLMGTADVIPGVSGGTIAFITGIYQKLIGSLNEIDLPAFKMLITLRWKALYKKLNGSFLLMILTGVFIAVFSLARVIKYLLHTYPEVLWAFFFGLIIASVIVVSRHVKNIWTPKNMVAVVIGAVVAYLLSTSDIVQTPHTPLFVYMAGIISIVAMILPGISGSYLLVILDKYQYIIDVVAGIAVGVKDMIAALATGDMAAFGVAWNDMEVMPMIIFELGTLTGIIGFSKILNWLFKKYHDLTIAILTGFMAGSLVKIWPWKETISTYIDRKGNEKPLLEANVLPEAYDSYFFLAVGMAIFGFVLVYFMERYVSNRQEKKTQE